MNLFSMFVATILTENIVLTKFLGLCPFMGTSSRTKNAFGMGLAVTFVIMISSIITYFVYNYILVPTNTIYLKTLVFVFIIALLVQTVELFVKKKLPSLHQTLGIYLPLITTNCAVLGVTLQSSEYSFIETFVYSLGSSIGFVLVIYIFASIREKLRYNDIPKSFKGYPIAFITAAIMAMIFSRYGS